MQTTHAQVRPEQEIREIADADERFDERSSEGGMATAELLGNAALGIAALVAIWAVLQAVGLDVMEWIRAQLQV
jgi:hypothetical protein